MPAFFGYDLSNWNGSGLPDLEPSGRLVTGNELLAQSLLNRLFCEPGSYRQSPNFGLNLASYINQALTATFSTAALAQQISKELRKDERVDSVSPVVTYDAPSQTLTVSIDVTPVATGNFSLSLKSVAGADFQATFQEAA